MDTELTALEARCGKTRALKQGMMQGVSPGQTKTIGLRRKQANRAN